MRAERSPKLTVVGRRRGVVPATRNDFVRLLTEQEGESGEYTPPQQRTLSIPDAAGSVTEQDASVDQKIDGYLLQFEREAVNVNDHEAAIEDGAAPVVAEGKSLYRWLFEQAAEPPAGDTGGPEGADLAGDSGDMGLGDLGGDLSADGGGDDSDGAPKAAQVAPVPKINIRRFAEGVARLVINYRALIDPRSVIINRAMYYISRNYSPKLAKELVSILERDFKLSAKTISQKEAEVPSAPTAANAGPESGGVPSGGGGGSSSAPV